MSDLSKQAINAALEGNWEKALQLNLKLVKQTGPDADAFNRIARAYCETGELDLARKYAQKALKIDPFNQIASKSLLKWKSLKNGHVNNTSIPPAQAFLEEPGKTRVVSLVKLSDASILVSLDCGDPLKIKVQKHAVSIEDIEGKHIGRLPDDIASRLQKLITEGNEYSAIVKSSSHNEVKVLLREVKQANHIKHISSFPTERITYVAFAPPELVHNKKSIGSP